MCVLSYAAGLTHLALFDQQVFLIVFKRWELIARFYTPKIKKLVATHSSTLAWKIPWTEEPGRLQSVGSQRVRHDWATSLSHIKDMRKQFKEEEILRTFKIWNMFKGKRVFLIMQMVDEIPDKGGIQTETYLKISTVWIRGKWCNVRKDFQAKKKIRITTENKTMWCDWWIRLVRQIYVKKRLDKELKINHEGSWVF